MELLRKVSSFVAPQEDLKSVYTLFIRSLLEQSTQCGTALCPKKILMILKEYRSQPSRLYYRENITDIKMLLKGWTWKLWLKGEKPFA